MPGPSRPSIPPMALLVLVPSLLVVPVLSSAFGGLGHPVVCRADAIGATTVNRPAASPTTTAAPASTASPSPSPSTGMVHLGDDGPNVITREPATTATTRVGVNLDDGAANDPSGEVASSALVLERGAAPRRCEGFDLTMRVDVRPNGRVRIALPVVNTSTRGATATVELRVGSTRLPVTIGRVGSGTTRTSTLDVVVPPGDSAISASLLLGP